MTENAIAWDLTEIFSSPEDSKILKTMDSLDKIAEQLIKSYKGKINSTKFLPKDLLDLIKKNEKLIADLGDLDIYANRLYDANQNDLIAKGLKKRVDDFETELLKKITFIDIEIGKLFQTRAEIIEDPILKDYKHYLKKFKRLAPHLLSEVEEQIILEKDQFGIKAWSDLQSEWLNSREYLVEVEGEEKVLSYGEAKRY